jgi:hypothetical protein
MRRRRGFRLAESRRETFPTKRLAIARQGWGQFVPTSLFFIFASFLKLLKNFVEF